MDGGYVENFNPAEGYVAKYFTIKSFYVDNETFYFIIYDYDKESFAKLIEDLKTIGYVPFLRKYGADYKIIIARKPEFGKSNIYINIVLFFATIATTIYAGYSFGGSIKEGIAFSIALLSIIGTHETAHFLAARKHGVEATLPYFIPAPTLIGTFGAVINVKSPIPDKNALFDLGFSGPMAGIIVTIPVLVIGISLSAVAPMQKGTLLFFPSILMYIITYFLSPGIPVGYVLELHPVAFAGWVGIIVTMLNLMPVAFLDGGHIARALFTEKIHKIFSYIGIIITMLLGWIPMALLMILILFITKKHQGPLDDVSGLSRGRKVLAFAIFIIFIMSLSTIPIVSL